jgi:hypothetical protein
MNPCKIPFQEISSLLTRPDCVNSEVDVDTLAALKACLNRLDRSRHDAACCSGHSQNNVDSHAPQTGPREELKRKSMETETESAAPAAKKQELERKWHPRFKDDSSRVILLSNDGIHLCIDKDLLRCHR